MPDYPTIRGSKPTYYPKPDRQLATGYLHMSKEGTEARQELQTAIDDEEAKKRQGLGEGVPCIGDDWFTSDDLPTDREAMLACARCPVFDLCRNYAETTHAAWGVHAGKVYGRKLARLMADDED